MKRLGEQEVAKDEDIINILDEKRKKIWKQTNMDRDLYDKKIRAYLIEDILEMVSMIFDIRGNISQLRLPTIITIHIMRKLNTNKFLKSDFISEKCKDCKSIAPYDITLDNVDYEKWKTVKGFLRSYSTNELYIFLTHLLQYQKKLIKIFLCISHRYKSIGIGIFNQVLQVEWDYWIGEFVVREKIYFVDKIFPQVN